MTVELTLNTDIGLLSVGNADTGEDFGPAMTNLYEGLDGVASGVFSTLGGGSGGIRDTRIDGRGSGGGPSSTRLMAAAAAAATNLGTAGRGVMDAQGTLWPAFAMHQPGDSVTFLPRRADDSYTLPRPLSGSASSAAAAAAAVAGPYQNLQSFMGGIGGGMMGGGGGMPGGEGLAGQALPLGYPDPLLVEHARAALEMAAAVLREAVRGGTDGVSEDLGRGCERVVTR